jgi:chemotaxis protein CheX
MKPIFPLSVYQSDLTQIVESVFATMLSLEVRPTQMEWAPSADTLTAAIHFAGEWKGAVMLECTRPQACEFTHRLMSIPMPTAVNDDVRDGMGELANMLAGNLKSVLPHGIGLSMPLVVEGRDYSVRLCGSGVIDRIPFSSTFGVLWVTLVEVLSE